MNGAIALVWMLTIVLDTVGQLSFKSVASAAHAGSRSARWLSMARRPMLWLGLSCYVFEFLAWTAFLSLVPLSRGILLGSINIVVIAIAGRLFFNERLTSMHIAGIGLISAGVAVVGLGS